jgi:phospholipase A1
MKQSLAALIVLQILICALSARGQSSIHVQGLDPAISDPNSDFHNACDDFSADQWNGARTPLFADALSTTGPSLDTGAATAPTTRSDASAAHPEESSSEAGNFPSPGSTYGLSEFVRHFAPHEPMYIVGGTQSPNIKFQFSIRYRIFTPDGPLATDYPFLKGFNVGYTQMSLWDLNGPSPAFFDTNYRPEFFYYLENVPYLKLPSAWQLGAQMGVGHESNGKGGTQERSLNIAYIRPIFTITDTSDDLFIALAPKLYEYIGNRSDNPDIAHFRGYADIRIVVGQLDGLQLATIGRIGDSGNRGSVQFDLTYPLTRILRGNADLSLDLQYFDGYGESLLTYNQRTSVFRVGIALVR